MDSMQFAYWPNRSVDDAVNLGLHYIWTGWGTYARILFIEFDLNISHHRAGALPYETLPVGCA